MRLHRDARRLLMLAVAALGAACSGDGTTDPVSAGGPTLEALLAAPFSDPFDALDESRWSKEEHALGRGFFYAANVQASGGSLYLMLPAATYNGGEIRTREQVGPGTYTAWMRTPSAPGSITAFFLYQGRVRSDEIDIEIYNDGSRRILLTIWVRGRQTHSVTKTLGVDPSAGVHQYRIDWSTSSVRFSVDGVVIQEWTNKLPREPMYLMSSVWWPTWLSGSAPSQTVSLQIDRIDAAPR